MTYRDDESTTVPETRPIQVGDTVRYTIPGIGKRTGTVIEINDRNCIRVDTDPAYWKNANRPDIVRVPERVTQERPTAPYRAGCGHLCNCFPWTHKDEQWYTHDFYDVYAADGNTVIGDECGRCYEARHGTGTPATAEEVSAAFMRAINI